MKVLFFSVKGTGHVNPTLPLVRGLIERGDDVTYVLTREWKDAVERLGATYLDTGTGPTFTTADYHPTAPFPLQLIPATAALMPRLVDLTRSIAPDVIVYDSCALWGRAVAQVVDRPAVASIATVLVDEADAAAMMPPGFGLDAKNEDSLVELRTKWNVETSFSEIGRWWSAENVVYSSPILNPHVPRGCAFHFVGPLERESGEHDLGARRRGRRRIYVAMGTVAAQVMKLDASFFRPFVDAFGGDDRYDLVMAVGNTTPVDGFAGVPDNVIVRQFVPQIPLLADVDVFVTHAGSNSMHEALYAGVPLVCIPCFADQPLNARRVAELGAGEVIAFGEVSRESITSAVERVLGSPTYREATARISRDLRATRGIEHAVEVLATAAARARYASTG